MFLCSFLSILISFGSLYVLIAFVSLFDCLFHSFTSDDIRSGQRRIYFDLKENKRGVFLRISSTASYGATRQTVALPAQGIIDIRNVLNEMIDEFGQEEEPQELPDFQEMRIERKRFYFDCGNNDRGSFLRISEVINFFCLFIKEYSN